MVERGKSGWALGKIAAAARALDVSSDFLLGLTDDPTPAGELARALAAATAAAELGDPAARAAAFEDGDYVGVSELASAAGDGAVVEQERVTGARQVPPGVARPPRARRPQLPGDRGQRRVDGADPRRRLLDPRQPRRPPPARRPNLRRAHRRRPHRQARRPGRRRRLAARQRQPQQERLAHAALASRRPKSSARSSGPRGRSYEGADHEPDRQPSRPPRRPTRRRPRAEPPRRTPPSRPPAAASASPRASTRTATDSPPPSR